MNFIIDCQIYPFHIMVHFGNKKDLIMNLKKYGINLSQKDIKGKYKSLFLNDNQTVLYMDIIPKTIKAPTSQQMLFKYKVKINRVAATTLFFKADERISELSISELKIFFNMGNIPLKLKCAQSTANIRKLIDINIMLNQLM